MTHTRPNVLWFCSDQQRFDTLGVTGNTEIRTPNIDRLAATGAAFTRAYSQAPICTPSRASFLTGMYPSTVHACTNGNDRWDEAAPLLPAMLAEAGYDCGLSGKLHLAGAQGRIEPRPENDGYRFFSWSHHATDDWEEGHAYADWLRSKGVDPTKLYQDNGYFPPELHQTTWCTDEAIRFIGEEREGPWFMSVNPFDPHGPFDCPPEYVDRYDPDSLAPPHFRESDIVAQQALDGADFQSEASHPDTFDAKAKKANYYGMIELLDHNVGRLLDYLEETGQRENTLVIYTSDHGETLGDHGLILKGCRFYESLVRVPLVISWPAGFRSGGAGSPRSAATAGAYGGPAASATGAPAGGAARLVDDLVELTDLAPTILEAVGLEIPARMVGKSLGPVLRGEADPRAHRTTVRSEYYHTLNNDAPGRNNFTGTYATMIRDDRYKLIAYHGLRKGELFDLEADPWEHENLWKDPAYAEVRFRLMEEAFAQTAFAVDLGQAQVTYF